MSKLNFLYLTGCSDWQSLKDKSSILSYLKQIQLFKKFSSKYLINLSEFVKIEEFKDKDEFTKQGKKGENFYIIRSGKVNIIRDNKYVRSLNNNDFFGERALFLVKLELHQLSHKIM